MGKTQCRYCRKSYIYTTAYITHLRRDHREKIRLVPQNSLPANRMRLLETYIELPDDSNPCEVPPTEDDSTSSASDSDNDFEDLDTNEREEPQTQQTHQYEGAGRPLDDPNDLPSDEENPFFPFESEQEYRFAGWAVKHRLSRQAIHDLIDLPSFQGLSSVTSAYKLFKTVNKMEYELDISSWKRGLVEFTLPGSESSRSEDRMAAFWYRNPVTCIEFLMKQPAFHEHMAYTPWKEYN